MNRQQRLTAACAMAGVTITGLATRLGVHRSTLYRWVERGEPRHEGVDADAVAAVLDCDPAVFAPDSPLLPTWAEPARAAPVVAKLERLRQQLGAPALDDVAEAHEAMADGVGGVLRAFDRADRDDLEVSIEALRAIYDEQGWGR